MDVTNLRENHQKLISYMKDKNYSKTYITIFVREIDRILQLADSKEWICYADVYLEYESEGHTANTLRQKRGIIAAIEQFDTKGKFPGDGNKNSIIPRSAYFLLIPEYKTLIDHYKEAAKKSGKKDSTIYTEASNTSAFLLTLQQLGIDKLEDATQESVLSAFLAPDGSPVRGCSFKKNVSAVFKAGLTLCPEGCTKVLTFLPEFREKRKNIQYLKADEVTKVKEALSSDDGPLTLSDKAIGMLALHTGLRGCDIAGLTLDSLDWENDKVSIKQQKTEGPLDLPLTAVVGNAVYDYLVSGRPEVEHGFVFVTQSRPYSRMSDRSIGNVAARIMKAAGIRQKPGDRKGFHLFRHRFATALLGNNIPRPVITELLGHASPDSLDVYLSADFQHLKECAISIERFPVAKGVFNHE